MNHCFSYVTLPQGIQLSLITVIMKVIFCVRRDKIAHVGPHTQIFDETRHQRLINSHYEVGWHNYMKH